MDHVFLGREGGGGRGGSVRCHSFSFQVFDSGMGEISGNLIISGKYF